MTRPYLELEDVLDIHALQISRYGGSAGVRDPGQLDAASYRPQSGYYQDLIEEAAALWESLSQNHPFIDGNKRAALASTAIFLGLNGLRLAAPREEILDFILGLYEAGEFRFEKLEPWLRANTALR